MIKTFIKGTVLKMVVLMLIALTALSLVLLKPRNFGRKFNAERDSKYVKEKLWSYNGGYKVGVGDFIVFDHDSTPFILKSDTIYYNLKPKAKVVRINKRQFLMKVESLESGEQGSYLNVEERLQ